ncbi:hypothetical protein EC968_001290 [Mortierella alpina]|nr:hypothetical protein EC968_001290 [Mortierella alpina]
MAMDTALINSWYEVVRLTDPLIWTLAMEGSNIPSDAAHDALLPQAQKSSKHHPHHCRHPLRQATSPTMTLSSRDHLSSSPSSHHTYYDSYCRSLLDPHSRNSLDWLKCLMQSSNCPTATVSGEEQGHSKQLKKKSLRMMLGTHVDFGLAGEGIVASPRTLHGAVAAVARRTESQGTGHCSLETEVAATSMSSGGCCRESYRHKYPAAPSATSSSCFVWMSVDQAGAAQGGEGLTLHAASTSPCNNASSTAARTPAARSSHIVSASMAASAVAAVAAHSTSETETGPANPLVDEQPTASAHHIGESGHGTRSGSTLSSMAAPSASSNSQRPVSATTAVSPSSSPSCTPLPSYVHAHTSTSNALTDTHTKSDQATGNKTNNNTEGDSTPTSSSIDADSSTSTSASTSAPPSHHSALILLSSSAFLHSAIEMTQKGLSRSKDATSAFLYRTFSPTYRICRLYVDSWNNGTQRRGLERIKTSVVRGDAFTLVRNTTTQMRDVWRRVMVAYRLKAASARAKFVTMASASAAWKAKKIDGSSDNGTGNERHSSGHGDNSSGSGSGSGSDKSSGNNTISHNGNTGVQADKSKSNDMEKDKRGPSNGGGSRTRR